MGMAGEVETVCGGKGRGRDSGGAGQANLGLGILGMTRRMFGMPVGGMMPRGGIGGSRVFDPTMIGVLRRDQAQIPDGFR